jgi:hypothetical protein
VRTDLDSQPARDRAHRLEQWQAAIRQTQGFVRKPGDLAFQQAARKFWIGAGGWRYVNRT